MLEVDFWLFVSYFGDIAFWVGAATVSTLFYRLVPKKSKRYLNWFIFATLPAVVISYFLVAVLKLFFAVPRPCGNLLVCPNDYSFPSGHSAVIFSAATVFIMFFPKKTKIQILLMGIAVLVAYSRVILGVHRTVDVVFGSFVGVLVAVLIYMNYKEIIKTIHGIKMPLK